MGQEYINMGIGVILAGIGWFGRELWGAMKELRAMVHKLEVDLPKTYTPKSDFETMMKKIDAGFQRIYDKLDEKEDKR